MDNLVNYVYFFLDLQFAVIMFILFFLCIFEKTARIKEKYLIAAMIASSFILFVSDAISWMCQLYTSSVFWAYTSNLFVYIDGYMLSFLFAHFLMNYLFKEKSRRIILIISTILLFITTLLTVISQFNGMFYSIVDGYYIRGDYFWISQIFPVCIILLDLIVVIKKCKVLGIKKTIAFMSYGIFPIIAILIQLIDERILLTYNVGGLVVIIIYIAVHMEDSIELYKNKVILQEMNLQLIMSQIKPHFIYNVLGTISYLCDLNPEVAKKAIIEFSTYLRRNLTSIETTEVIPFTEELEHINAYLYLEKLRFGNRLKVTYNLEVTDFYLPPLSLQPIIENAVKYGVSTLKDGGEISLNSFIYRNDIIIEIDDNGAGFDVENAQSDGKTHLGISNISERIERICKGSVNIRSEKGKGTHVKIVIPMITDNKGENI